MSDEQSISDGQLGRIQGDLAIMQRAIGLHLYFGSGIVIRNVVPASLARLAGVVAIGDSQF